jgi:hypothetical protein
MFKVIVEVDFDHLYKLNTLIYINSCRKIVIYSFKFKYLSR